MSSKSPATKARLWDRIPSAYKWGTLFAALGFVVHLSLSSRSTSNGEVTSCSYLDLGALFFAFLTVVAALAGVSRTKDKSHPSMQFGTTPSLVIAGVLVLVATYHVVAGLGLVGGPCN